MLTREELRQAILNSHKPKIVPVDAFGGTVYVREMNAQEVGDFFRWHSDNSKANGIDTMVAILVRTLCDAEGNRIFADEDADAMKQLHPNDIRKAYAVAARLNEVSDDDVDDAQADFTEAQS